MPYHWPACHSGVCRDSNHYIHALLAILLMNAYYDIRLTPEQREALLFAIDFTGGIASHEPHRLTESDQKHGTPMWEAHKLLSTAEEHPNIDDVYLYEAEHSGFKKEEVVLVEGIVRTTAISTRLSSQHLPVLINDYVQGAVEVNPCISTIYHKD